MPGRLKRNYHWVMLAVVFIGLFTAVGIDNNRTGIFIIPVTESLGFSRGLFSIHNSVKCVAATFSNLAFGMLFRRFGYRRLCSAGLAALAVGYLVCGFGRSVWMFYIGGAVLGAAECCIGMAIASRVITDWFIRRRGMILGIVMAASGLGGSVFSLLLERIISVSSWRYAYFALSAVLIAVGAVVFLLGRDTPESMGLVPYGKNAPDAPAEPSGNAEEGSEEDCIPLSELKRKPLFYLILGSILVMLLGIYAMLSSIVPQITDRGMGSSFAAAAQSVAFISMAAAKIGEGYLVDRTDPKRVLIAALVAGAAADALLAWADCKAAAIAAVLLYGLPIAAPSVLMPLYVGSLFGKKDLSGILGLTFALVTMTNIVVAPVLNFTYDLTGSYSPALYAAAALLALSLCLMPAVSRAAKRMRRAYAEGLRLRQQTETGGSQS